MKLPRLAALLLLVLAASWLTACGRDDASNTPGPAVSFVFPADARTITPDAVKGEWAVGPKIAAVRVEGTAISCINEKGEASRCEIREGKALLAVDWRVYAVLIADGKVLRWSDGSGWTR